MASESTHLTYKERLALTKERVKAANVGMSSESESVTPSVGARRKLILTKKSKGPAGSVTGTPSVGVIKDKGAADASSMAKPSSGPKPASGTKKLVIRETEAEMALWKQNEELQQEVMQARAKEAERQKRKERKRKEKEDAEKAKKEEEDCVAKEKEDARIAKEAEDAKIAKEKEEKEKEDARLVKKCEEKEEKEKEDKRLELEKKKKEEEDREEKKRKKEELRLEKRSKTRSEVPSVLSEASKSSPLRSKSGMFRAELGEAETFIKDGNLAQSCAREQQQRDDAQLVAIQPANLITLDTVSGEDEGEVADSQEAASVSPKEGDDAPATTSHGDVDPNLGDNTTLEREDKEGESDELLEEDLEEGKFQSKYLEVGRQVRKSV